MTRLFECSRSSNPHQKRQTYHQVMNKQLPLKNFQVQSVGDGTGLQLQDPPAVLSPSLRSTPSGDPSLYLQRGAVRQASPT